MTLLFAILAFTMSACGPQAEQQKRRPYAPKDNSDSEKAKESFVAAVIAREAGDSYPFVVSPPPMRIQKEVHGFKFAEDLSCRQEQPPGTFCAEAHPKAWSNREIEMVARLLGRLRSSSKLEGFFQTVHRNGFDILLRHDSIVRDNVGDGRWHRKYHPMSAHYAHRRMVVADSFFPPWDRDARRPQAIKTLVHVLAHAYDLAESHEAIPMPTLSVSADFLRMTGFTLNSERRWMIRGMSDVVRSRYFKLVSWREREMLEVLSRSQGYRRRQNRIRKATESWAARYSFPNFHAMVNPEEAFGEWVSEVYVAESTAQKINSELARWIARSCFIARPGSAPSMEKSAAAAGGRGS